MSWAADVAFGDFVAQFGYSFVSAHQFRQRHLTASTAAMGELMGLLMRRLR